MQLQRITLKTGLPKEVSMTKFSRVGKTCTKVGVFILDQNSERAHPKVRFSTIRNS